VWRDTITVLPVAVQPRRLCVDKSTVAGVDMVILVTRHLYFRQSFLYKYGAYIYIHT